MLGPQTQTLSLLLQLSVLSTYLGFYIEVRPAQTDSQTLTDSVTAVTAINTYYRQLLSHRSQARTHRRRCCSLRSGRDTSGLQEDTGFRYDREALKI